MAEYYAVGDKSTGSCGIVIDADVKGIKKELTGPKHRLFDDDFPALVCYHFVLFGGLTMSLISKIATVVLFMIPDDLYEYLCCALLI